jgi:hypothetical protein
MLLSVSRDRKIILTYFLFSDMFRLWAASTTGSHLYQKKLRSVMFFRFLNFAKMNPAHSLGVLRHVSKGCVFWHCQIPWAQHIIICQQKYFLIRSFQIVSIKGLVCSYKIKEELLSLRALLTKWNAVSALAGCSRKVADPDDFCPDPDPISGKIGYGFMWNFVQTLFSKTF